MPPPSPDVDAPAIADMLQGLLRRTHLSTPAEMAGVVAEEAAGIGATDTVLYLIDYEQQNLVPLPIDDQLPAEPLSVAGTVGGRAYSSTAILATAPQAGHQRLWIPLLDGTERLGVLGMTFDTPAADERLVTAAERYAHLVAILLVAKGAYGDAFEITRRRREMTIASELVWSLTPPLVYATDGLALAGLLEPCYDNGGDALDYAMNGRTLHLGVFDAMGHGLAAAGVAAFAVSAYRHSRRRGLDLTSTYAEMHQAVGEQFPDDRYVTSLIAELDVQTGVLRWITAGHPPPLVIRGGRRARALESPPAPPLGVSLAGRPVAVAEEALEPGDLLLLYTDGLTEAREADGGIFGLEGLSRFIEQEASAGQTAPETLRRLRQAILERSELRDDATALLLEWRSGSEAQIMPQTVMT